MPAPTIHSAIMCPKKTDRTLPSWDLPSLGQTDKKHITKYTKEVISENGKIWGLGELPEVGS